MFRRKKSQEPEPVRQLSISAPRAMTAQPPPQPSPTTPLYERFARTTAAAPESNAYGRDTRRIASESTAKLNSNGRTPTSVRPRVPSTGGGGSAKPKQVPPKPLPGFGVHGEEVRHCRVASCYNS